MPVPNPIFYSAILLCLPLAIILTVTAPRTSTTVTLTDPVVLLVRKPRNAPVTLKTFTIQPLPVIPDDDDESLFRLASRVDSDTPTGSTRRIAFMFLTTSSLPLAPLWEMYFNQTPNNKNLYNIYVHVDPGRVSNPGLTGVFEDRVIRSKPTFRNTPTLVAAARRLLANALLHDPCNYMFVLLSPSCIPLHSFNFTYTTLVSSPKSFIEVLRNEPGWFDRWAARGPDAMLPDVRPADFRIGSQFWALTRSHARVVARDVRLWEKFNKPCVRKDTCYPEEQYFPTLIRMVDPGGFVPATLTHVDWSVRAGGHPRMYGSSEVGPNLIRNLRNGRPRYGDFGDSSQTERRDPFLFARKFSPSAIGSLLRIAKDVIFND